MICKNCGLENPEGAKFCAGCGQMIENSNNAPQNNVPQNNVPQNNVPQNNVPQNNVPQNNAPQNNVPQNNVPQNNVPQNNIPQNNVPQNNAPQNNVPQNNVPQNNVPQNNIPQNNQVTYDPVTGQPIVNGVKKGGFKKHLPLIIGIAGGVVAVVVAIIVVFTFIGSTGINQPLGNLEKFAEDMDVESFRKTVPDFMATDSDVSKALNDSNFKLAKSIYEQLDLSVDFDVQSKTETDVTDNFYDGSNYTWKEHLQDYYSSEKNYDGGQVEAVKQAYVKIDIDIDNDLASSIADATKITKALQELSNKSVLVTFFKYDGDWYIDYDDIDLSSLSDSSSSLSLSDLL